MIAPVMPVYRRADLPMVRGEGCYLFDDKGRRYLDFATGIAVNALGHSHPHLVKTLQEQAGKLWHCSNLYRIPEQERLAERLVEATFADTVFFCNSGTEAVEAGVKIIRKYHYSLGDKDRHRIITFEGGFHGRSFAGISAGGNERAREGYGPLLSGFDRVVWGSLEAVRDAITEQTAGVLIEPIQGEGGVRAASTEFMQGLRALCDEHGILLMCDEVQCGMGRSGTLFAFEQFSITPDLVSVAKGIGGGFPLGALLASEQAASCMTPGSHGSTYGSNPLAMSVGNAVLDIILKDKFLNHVNEMSEKLKASLEEIVVSYPDIFIEYRGRGLMAGLVVHHSAYETAVRMRASGLLAAPCAGGNVIRILPPLILQKEQIDEAVKIIHTTLNDKES